jgi:catechol 2,3-dioxygenase-like lactoylglutathione lyase family enzyme
VPAISSIRHVGIVVRDIEASLQFYEGVLGLETYRRETEEGEFINQLTGLDSVKLEWVKLIIPNGGLIELLQYHSPPNPIAQSNPIPAPSNRLGCSHVALTVVDLQGTYRLLLERGYSTKSPPILTANRKALILYCHDPDGTILELIQDLITPKTDTSHSS